MHFSSFFTVRCWNFTFQTTHVYSNEMFAPACFAPKEARKRFAWTAAKHLQSNALHAAVRWMNTEITWIVWFYSVLMWGIPLQFILKGLYKESSKMTNILSLIMRNICRFISKNQFEFFENIQCNVEKWIIFCFYLNV